MGQVVKPTTWIEWFLRILLVVIVPMSKFFAMILNAWTYRSRGGFQASLKESARRWK